MRKVYLAGLAALAMVALSGCGLASGRKVTVEMTNFKFTPALIEAKPGEKLEFEVVNKSTDTMHEFEGDTAKGFEELELEPGKSGKVTWTTPKQPGEYIIECALKGHDGMKLTVVVK